MRWLNPDRNPCVQGSIRSLGFNFTVWFAPFFSVRILTRKVASAEPLFCLIATNKISLGRSWNYLNTDSLLVKIWAKMTRTDSLFVKISEQRWPRSELSKLANTAVDQRRAQSQIFSADPVVGAADRTAMRTQFSSTACAWDRRRMKVSSCERTSTWLLCKQRIVTFSPKELWTWLLLARGTIFAPFHEHLRCFLHYQIRNEKSRVETNCSLVISNSSSSNERIFEYFRILRQESCG